MKIENDLCRSCFGAGKWRGDYCGDCNGTGMASNPVWRARFVGGYIVLVVIAIIAVLFTFW